MRACGVVFLVLGMNVTLAPALQPDPMPKATAARIAELIEQLRHDEFATRQVASKALEAVGKPALDALRKATRHPDLEVHRRALQIISKITSG